MELVLKIEGTSCRRGAVHVSQYFAIFQCHGLGVSEKVSRAGVQLALIEGPMMASSFFLDGITVFGRCGVWLIHSLWQADTDRKKERKKERGDETRPWTEKSPIDETWSFDIPGLIKSCREFSIQDKVVRSRDRNAGGSLEHPACLCELCVPGPGNGCLHVQCR